MSGRSVNQKKQKGRTVRRGDTRRYMKDQHMQQPKTATKIHRLCRSVGFVILECGQCNLPYVEVMLLSTHTHAPPPEFAYRRASFSAHPPESHMGFPKWF
jgi:hypothetical protein